MDGKKFIEIKKPVEIVHELKEENQIPSFEEFMKSYENDGKVNYAEEIIKVMDLVEAVAEVTGI